GRSQASGSPDPTSCLGERSAGRRVVARRVGSDPAGSPLIRSVRADNDLQSEKGADPMALGYRQQTGCTLPRPCSQGGAKPRSLFLSLVLLLGATLGARPAGAAPTPKLPAIHLTYRGGPLIQQVKVTTLFWGASWQSSSLTS